MAVAARVRFTLPLSMAPSLRRQPLQLLVDLAGLLAGRVLDSMELSSFVAAAARMRFTLYVAITHHPRPSDRVSRGQTSTS
jgi:hypothetical protein